MERWWVERREKFREIYLCFKIWLINWIKILKGEVERRLINFEKLKFGVRIERYVEKNY